MENTPPAFSVFTFDRMITPTIIRVLYFLSCALVILGGLIALAGAVLRLASTPIEGLVGVVVALVGMLIGLLTIRIYCELLLLLFRMSDTLEDIRAQGRPAAPVPA